MHVACYEREKEKRKRKKEITIRFANLTSKKSFRLGVEKKILRMNTES